MLARRLLCSSSTRSGILVSLRQKPQGCGKTTPARFMSYTAPLQDMNFVLHDVLNYQEHVKKIPHQGGEGMSKDTVDMVLQESAKFAEQVLAPLNSKADEVGCVHVGDYEVKTPPGFKEAYDQFVQAGWQGLCYPEAYGGQGMSYSLSLIATDMLATANWTWTMYPGLSKGCINTILAHGTKELKEKYVPKLVAGEWTGTMCLTEPHCGSDLAQVKTKAVPQADGTYKVSGTKIFISCGDHDMVDNIVHCVLARLPDAPAGTKGISLFLVPKKKVGADGSIGATNGVKVGRIEHKMGCHGSSTCELIFEESEGFLIGEKNKGLNHMFTFINTSRLGTAIQGIAAAEGSFQNGLWYAKDRLAMRSLNGPTNPELAADPIIVHPEVRRMLLTQKAIAEGGRLMVYECGLLVDLMAEATAKGDHKEAKRIDEELGFSTPILKGFLTERGVEAANLGIQLYGGHGYIKTNKQEQIFRDCRISALWEGTTQIQALDLLARKILLGGLTPINHHCLRLYGELFKIIKDNEHTSVKIHGAKLLKHVVEWHYLTLRVAAQATQNKDVIGIASVDYLMFAGYVTLAHAWLRMEIAALEKLKDENVENADFYKTKVHMSQFVFSHLLPRTRGHVATMFTPVNSMMGLHPSHFSFDYAQK